jgi:hypothetical protein
MRRARSIDNSSAVSLFPFLAVLVCTMGALIVLLVVMAQQAQVRASRTTQHATGSAAEQQAEIAQLTSRLEDLAHSRSAVTQHVTDDRRVLSHLEDHIERLRDRLAEVKIAAEQLVDDGNSSAEQRQRDAAEVARLQRLIAEAQQQLAESRLEAERKRRHYAIVPYRGKNGTDRRPIYIECRSDAVIVQPEGVVLKPADFDPPLGPGNPLAAAVRAAREYLAESNTADGGVAADPYPLLLVRPDGVAAYYKAREALASWDADFGYELVDADWTLALPVADPLLAQRESRAVEVARHRREQLILAAPSRYGGGRSRRGRAAPNRGGFQRFTATDSEGHETGDQSGHGSYRGRRRGGLGGRGGRGPSPGNNPYALSSGRQTQEATPSSRGAHAALGAEASPHAATTGPGQAGGPARSAEAPSAAGLSPQSPRGPVGRPSSEVATTDAPGSPDGTAASTSRLGNPAGAAASGAGSAGSVGRAPSGGSPGGTMATGRPGVVESLAARRGADWALPRTSRTAVPISRTVQIVVRQDRLVIMLDRRAAGSGIEVPIPGRTVAAVDRFISTLWDHIATWGIAGKGMYWRPVVHLHAAPDAAWRADQLKKLLDGSGLELVDKGAVVR